MQVRDGSVIGIRSSRERGDQLGAVRPVGNQVCRSSALEVTWNETRAPSCCRRRRTRRPGANRATIQVPASERAGAGRDLWDDASPCPARRVEKPPTPLPADVRPISLGFTEPQLEAEYRRREFSSNLPTTRLACLLAIAIWIVWGVVVQGYLGTDAGFDTLMRYGVFIPLAGVGLALSFAPGFERLWRPLMALLILLTGAAWIVYAARLHAMPVDYGYVGLILIITFGYTLVRLPFRLFGVVSGSLILGYFLFALRRTPRRGLPRPCCRCSTWSRSGPSD